MEEERETEARGARGWLSPSCPNNISLRSARLLWRATSGSPRGVADLLNAGASSHLVVGVWDHGGTSHEWTRRRPRRFGPKPDFMVWFFIWICMGVFFPGRGWSSSRHGLVGFESRLRKSGSAERFETGHNPYPTTLPPGALSAPTCSAV